MAGGYVDFRTGIQPDTVTDYNYGVCLAIRALILSLVGEVRGHVNMLLAFIVLNDPELSWTQHDCTEMHECEGTSEGATQTGHTWTQGNQTWNMDKGVSAAERNKIHWDLGLGTRPK